MSRSTLLVLAVLAGACLSMPAEAQYKWRDKAGHIQYSDLPPPPGVSDADILQQPAAATRRSSAAAAAAASAASASTGPNAVAPKVEPELEAKRKQADAEAAAKQKAQEDKNDAIRASNCTKARTQMQTLQAGTRIARTTANGEREILDDNGRAEEMRNMQAIMASDCK